MDARNSFFNYISSNKPFSSNKSTDFTHFLPLYFLPPHILEREQLITIVLVLSLATI